MPETYPGQPMATPMGLEAELAERLDTVLGIAGRLAASHDRRELLRMIVDDDEAGPAGGCHDHPDASATTGSR